MKRGECAAQSVQMHAAHSYPPFRFTACGCYELSKNCFTERVFKRRNAEMRNGVNIEMRNYAKKQ